MALSIKDERADALAREISHITGESITRTVTRALEEKLAFVKKRSEADIARRIAAIRKIQEEVRASFKGQPIPSSKELMDDLYDEYGLPK